MPLTERGTTDDRRLDDELAGLDALELGGRSRIAWGRRLWSATGLTIVFVTHNVREAARLSDRIVLLTSLPGKVADEFPVTIDRPRRIDSPEVMGLAADVTDRLRAEVRRHSDDHGD